MRTIGLIPARGGSKGVPRKNVRLLQGKPLMSYSIDAARASQRLHRFFVSTDDDEIEAVAKTYGVPVVRRPPELAEDTTPVTDVVSHFIAQTGADFDVFVLLQPTCPQRTGQDIDQAVILFDDAGVQSVISVYQVEDHHPARMYHCENGRLIPLHPELLARRRQDLPPVFHRNGAIYACRVGFFQRTGSLWDEQPAALLMPRERSLNVDDWLDFRMAELILADRD